MPIRINLLAEAQALEELRRRDPVKRAMWGGGLLVAALLVWSAWLQLQAIIARRSLSTIETQLAAQDKRYRAVCDSQKRLADVKFRFNALNCLATNRLLYGTLLNALQQTPVQNVQLTHFKADQSYIFTEATKPQTNDNRVIPARPATVTERILLTLEAKDSGPNPGDQVNQFKKKVLDTPYFQEHLLKTNGVRLANLSPPQTTADSKPFVLFTLECRYPEKTR